MRWSSARARRNQYPGPSGGASPSGHPMPVAPAHGCPPARLLTINLVGGAVRPCRSVLQNVLQSAPKTVRCNTDPYPTSTERKTPKLPYSSQVASLECSVLWGYDLVLRRFSNPPVAGSTPAGRTWLVTWSRWRPPKGRRCRGRCTARRRFDGSGRRACSCRL